MLGGVYVAEAELTLWLPCTLVLRKRGVSKLENIGHYPQYLSFGSLSLYVVEKYIALSNSVLAIAL